MLVLEEIFKLLHYKKFAKRHLLIDRCLLGEKTAVDKVDHARSPYKELCFMQVVPGCDMAGIVVAKGSGVTKFDVGDEVYGNIQNFNLEGKLNRLGTLAEFTVVEENLVAMKPKNLTFEASASFPLAIQTAVEGFRTARFQEGQSVFIVGGAGGVGSLAVQLAKHVYGASSVAATTSTTKVEFVKSLGADKVVDYTNTAYEEIPEKYDLVYDTIGKFIPQQSRIKKSILTQKLGADDKCIINATTLPIFR